MLTAMLGHMYIIALVTAALGACPIPAPGPDVDAAAYYHIQHHHHHPAAPSASRPAAHSPPLPTRVCIFALLQLHAHLTPHGLCFEALARRLRIRAHCHCRGLRAPLYS
ncbi:hypothetical protein FB567DRAFT_77890 [Paraphoma chrysanthemicola]|uniref:Secreted protein n=1 Tax=Paraphoma chrysanthemicola TaxID=798071 RepID=A0A8K0VXJ8_9PLEO|nr:hypothetical protein FB567DRAFT_77890 [Paraphoma chrysanthemicola]